MKTIPVQRPITDITAAELLEAYEAAGDKTELRAEIVRRLEPQKAKQKATAPLLIPGRKARS